MNVDFIEVKRTLERLNLVKSSCVNTMPKLQDLRPRARRSRLDSKRGPIAVRPLPAYLPCAPSNGKDPPDKLPESPTDGGSPAKRFVTRRQVSVSPGRLATRSRESSPGSGRTSPSRRAPSPGALDAALVEAVQRRIQQAQKVRLYLLQQTGPHSFLVAGDAPGQKYRVVIGPQSCTCGKSLLCVHVLFVMTRVLRVQENDYRLFCRTLKNFEVESLVESFRRRRQSRVSGTAGSAGAEAHLPTVHLTSDQKSDESCCPICLLEIEEGESLVRCDLSCHNLLHHQCMSVWAEECRRQQERVICPLCRAAWPQQRRTAPNTPTAEPETARSPPLPRRGLPAGDAEMRSPQLPRRGVSACDSETPRSPQLARRGLPACDSDTPRSPQVLRRGLSGCDSETPRSPQLSRRGLPSTPNASDSAAPRRGSLTSPAGEPDPPARPPGRRGSVTSPACDLEPGRSPQLGRRQPGRGSLRRSAVRLERLESVERRQTWSQILGREVVQLVFSRDWQMRDTGIRRLSEELTRTLRRPNSRTAEELVHSVADLLAVLCADPVHKVFLGAIKCLGVLLQHVRSSSAEEAARLRDSLTPLVDALLLRSADANRRSAQLSCWTLEQLARGCGGQLLLGAELDGLQLVLERLLQECRSGTDSWQWCLGRLLVADHFLQHFPQHFSLAPLGGATGGGCGYVVRLAEFAHRALTHPHVTVSKLARRVFVQMALAASAEPAAHAHINELLAALDSNLQARLKRRIRSLWEGLQPSPSPRSVSQTPGCCLDLGGGGGGCTGAEGGAGGRRPRPTFLPLDSASVAAGFRRKQSQLRQGAAPRSAPLQAALFPQEGATAADSAAQPAGAELHRSGSNSSCSSGMEVDPANSSEPPPPPPVFLQHLPGYATQPVEEIIVYPQEPDMEGGTPVCTYTEEVDWRRGPLLGTGAFSTCYQACDLRSGHLMAVKQVHLSAGSGSCGGGGEEERERRELALREEVRLLARLQHPHVVRLLGATRRPALMNLFTEWEAGGSVSLLLERYGPMCSDVIRRYTCHLVDGLAYLHDNHVLHRDLKGANLLVDCTGQTLKIADFGTAAVLGAGATVTGEFTGQVLGTVAFMAPEVLRGHHYGRSCDVWSVGCCVIEMATGRPPWDAHTCSNHFALLFKIAGSMTPPPMPCHLSDDLKTLVTDCHRLDGDVRPTAKQLLHYPCFKGIL